MSLLEIDRIKELDELLEDCTLTGSRCWGVENDLSDYDYFTYTNILRDITIRLEIDGIKVQSSNYYNSIRFEYDNKQYNIWSIHPSDMSLWELTNSTFTFMAGESEEFKLILEDRRKRHGLFESIRGCLKIAGMDFTPIDFNNVGINDIENDLNPFDF